MQDLLGTKRIYTTGDIARIFDVNINTVVKWFEEGMLKGYKLPNSTARRVPRAELVDFMVSRNIPMTRGPRESINIMLVTRRPGLEAKFRKMVENAFGYSLRVAGSSFESGFLCAERAPDVIFFDEEYTDFKPGQYLNKVSSQPQFAHTKMIIITDRAFDKDTLEKCGYDLHVKLSARSNAILDAVDNIVLKKKTDMPRFKVARD